MLIDSFTDTAGTNLSAHTADDGGTWTQRVGNPYIFTSGGDRIRHNGTARSVHTHSRTPPGPDYTVSAQLVMNGLGSGLAMDIGICGRHQGATDSYYGILARSDVSPTWRLHKVVGGVLTVPDTTAFTFVEGQTYTVALRMSRGSVRAYVDDVLICWTNDDEITGPGLFGVIGDSDAGGVEGNTPHLDSLSLGAGPLPHSGIMPRHTYAWL